MLTCAKEHTLSSLMSRKGLSEDTVGESSTRTSPSSPITNSDTIGSKLGCGERKRRGTGSQSASCISHGDIKRVPSCWYLPSAFCSLYCWLVVAWSISYRMPWLLCHFSRKIQGQILSHGFASYCRIARLMCGSSGYCHVVMPIQISSLQCTLTCQAMVQSEQGLTPIQSNVILIQPAQGQCLTGKIILSTSNHGLALKLQLLG